MYIVAHVYGGILKDVYLAPTRESADLRSRAELPDACDCDRQCLTYQEVFILEAEPNAQPAAQVDYRHSPEK